MKFTIKNQQDFWAGLMFIAFGLFAIYVARDYPMGSAMRMGPGYFPTYLGGLMAFIGAVILIMSTRIVGEKVTPFAWRPMFFLGISFLVYGQMMERFEAGFIPSIAAVVIISSFAIRDFRPVELAMLTTVLAVGTTALFIYGIDLPYPLFWWSY